jgi:putative DNA primase/helicase
MAFLNEVTLDPEDKRALLEHAAYVLIRSNFLQKAFLYVGEGANGKSTWFKILMALVGAENVVSESIHDLETNRFACASLDGKLVNLYADVNATELSHTGRLKLLISGDSIRAEKKHKPVFTLYNHCKLFFSANQLPQVQDLTDAWLRRWIILTWRRKFENENQDRTLIENLTTPGELSGLLNVLVALAKRLLQTRTLSYEPTAQQVRAEWILKADIMQAFLSSEVKVENGSYVSKTELYQKYVDWSITKHFAPKGRRSFNEAVQAKLPVRENWVKPGGRGGKTVRVWRDIALNASSSTRSTESNARISSKPDKIKGREVEKESQANCGNRGTLEDFSEPIGE